MIDFRPVVFLDGLLLVILALAMAVPSVAGPLSAGGDGAVFLGCAAATAALGGVMALGTMPSARLRLSGQQSFLLVVTGVLLTSLCAAFPLRFASPHLSFADAWFEAVSGLTTTGATLIGDLDHMSQAVLLWRALLNWLGGVGIVALAVVVLPALKLGGVQMIELDVGASSGLLRNRIVSTGKIVLAGYLLLSLLAGIALWLAGMTPFEAVCHAMSAISTGGFSTSDQSLRHWGAPVQWVAMTVMIVGASSLPLMLLSSRRRSNLGHVDEQLGAYLLILIGFTLSMLFWRWSHGTALSAETLRTTLFTAVSFVTTTGFVVADYAGWGGATHVAFFLMVFIGGCIGSPSGGIKVFRWQVLAAVTRGQINQILYPHRVIPMDFNGRRVSDQAIENVLAFFALYLMTFALHAAILTGLGMDLMSALSGSAAALGNVGRGVGEIIGTSGNWQGIPKAAKWVLAVEMIIGRLELFSVFILFTPGFWKE